ncbi:hypothetical protein FB561_5060 [Kribbella amoyensis]|uniref:LppX_LprAFG lipoprotein n=1 Tax=Kribbella amoyensis TaxID=996641 RepID=A0A561BYL2_9ACTN|nr:hypothetical protein [Kribbella amoyensis]TWD83891.1 hypothetical protein FB561_5060 [Kribbella amoyensis]
MRFIVPCLLASALALSGCGGAPAAAPAVLTPSPTPTPAVTSPVPAELTKANLANRTLAALKKKGSFQVEVLLIERGGDRRYTDLDYRANVRLTGTSADLSASTKEVPLVIRSGGVTYFEDDSLTGSSRRPWVRLNPKGKSRAERDANEIADTVIGLALSYQVLGGATHATSFQRGGQPAVDATEAGQEYIFTVDPRKAAGEFFAWPMIRDAVGTLNVSVAVDAHEVPRRIEYVVRSKDGSSLNVRVILRGFGQKTPVVPPPAAKIGKLR